MDAFVVMADDQRAARRVVVQGIHRIRKSCDGISFIGFRQSTQHTHCGSGPGAKEIRLVRALKRVDSIAMTRKRMQLGDFGSHDPWRPRAPAKGWRMLI